MASYTTSNIGEEDLAPVPRSSQLSSGVVDHDERSAKTHLEESAPTECTGPSSTPPSDGKDHLTLASDVLERSREADREQQHVTHPKGCSPASSEPCQNTPPKNNLNEQVGGLNQRRESPPVHEDSGVSLIKGDGTLASGLSNDDSGLALHDDSSHIVAFAQLEQGASLLAQHEDSGVLAELEQAIDALRIANAHLSQNDPMKVECLNRLGTSFLRRFRRSGDVVDLDEAITAQQQGVRLTPDGHLYKSACLSNLGLSFVHRFEYLGDAADLDEAITSQQQAIRLTPDDHPSKPEYLHSLANSFHSRFEHTGRLDDLDEAITAQQQAVYLTPDEHLRKPSYLGNLGIFLKFRFEYLEDLADLDEAITARRQAVHLTPDSHPDKPGLLNKLGTYFQSRFEHLGSLDDLNRAVDAQQQATCLTPDGHPDKPTYLSSLGSSFHIRFERLGGLGDLDKAIMTRQETVRLTPDDHPDKPGRLSNLGMIYLRRFERLDNISDLDEAITAQQQAVHLAPDDYPYKPACFSNLGTSLHSRFERLGNQIDLDEAITAHQQAVHLVPDDDPHRPDCLGGLGTSLQSRFDYLGNLTDLDEAITALQQAIRLAPDDSPSKAKLLEYLGISFRRRFERLSSLADLDDALTALRQAVHLTPDDHPEKPARLGGLGVALHSQFDRLGNLANLDEAITTQQHALRLTPDGHPKKSGRLSNLGTGFLTRFEQVGALSDLDEAITTQQQAVRLTPDADPGIRVPLNNLGTALFRRFERLHDLVDLDEAITAQQHAVRLVPDGHPDEPTYLNNLGASFFRRFQTLSDPADIDKATNLQQQAVRATADDHIDKPGRLINLGIFHLRRFGRSGDLSELEEAITVQRQAIRLAPDGHSDKPVYLCNLGNSLLHRFAILSTVVDLDEAITVHQQVVSLTPHNHPDKPLYLNNLGSTLDARFQHQPDGATLAQAISTYSQSAKSSSGSPSLRFTAAQQWAALCFPLRPDETLDAYSTLIDLVPRVVWLGRTVEQRYRDISTIGNVVSEAAAAATSFGEPELALEWLEQGRSIVWGQILQLRTPLDNLRQHHPHEADRLETISRALESAGTAQSHDHLGTLIAGTSQTLDQAAQAHRRLAEEYERLIEHIRSLRDFDEFLLPKKATLLCNAAISGPVVIVNSHENRCDALILLPDSSRVSHVALSGLHASDVSKMQGRLAELIGGTNVAERACGPYEPTMLPRWDEEMPDILGQLWLHIAEPVLRHLKMLQRPIGANMPHVTWCLTGRLTFLPVHAAGLYGEKDLAKIFDYVVSSYTPTLTALLGAKRPPARPIGCPSLLVVSQPDAPMQQSLPGTIREANAIKALQNRTGCLHVAELNGQEATVDAVLKGMENCNWIHLACHGIQDPKRPTDSAFLINGQLTLSEIMQQSFTRAELAVLSACQTAKGDHELPEEAIHLAAGMLMAGYRGVVGTMWSIRDDDAPIVVEKFYTYLIHEAGGDSMKAAYALHNAVGHLRDSGDGCSFGRWVPFIYLGVCSTS